MLGPNKKPDVIVTPGFAVQSSMHPMSQPERIRMQRHRIVAGITTATLRMTDCLKWCGLHRVKTVKTHMSDCLLFHRRYPTVIQLDEQVAKRFTTLFRIPACRPHGSLDARGRRFISSIMAASVVDFPGVDRPRSSTNVGRRGVGHPGRTGSPRALSPRP